MLFPKHIAIKDIPYPGLRKVATERLNEYQSRIRKTPEPDMQVAHFEWLATPEGGKFWFSVHSGIYDGRFEKPKLIRI